MALGLVPVPPCQQRAEDVLAELGPARHHVAQPRAVERDHVRRLDGHAGADRRLTGERGDVADERVAVRLRDDHVLAGLAVDELDEPALDHVERCIPDGVLVKHFTGLERARARRARRARPASHQRAAGRGARRRGPGNRSLRTTRVVATRGGYRERAPGLRPGGPAPSRRARSAGSSARCAGPRGAGSSSRRISRLTAMRPISASGWRTVVSAGVTIADVLGVVEADDRQVLRARGCRARGRRAARRSRCCR